VDIPALRPLEDYIDWPALRELKDEHLKLQRRLNETQAELGHLRAGMEAARQEDRLALAKALREGKKDPGSKAVSKLEAEIAKKAREVEGLEGALAQVLTDASLMVQAEAPAMVGDLNGVVGELDIEQRELLGRLASIRGRREAARRFYEWIERLDPEPINENLPAQPNTISITGIDTLSGRQPGEQTIAEVLAFLRAEAADAAELAEYRRQHEDLPAELLVINGVGSQPGSFKKFVFGGKGERKGESKGETQGDALGDIEQ